MNKTIKNLLNLSLVTIISLMLYSCSSDETKKNEKEEAIKVERIAVHYVNGVSEFFNKVTKKKFIPIGYNYTHLEEFTWNGVKLKGHSTFNDGNYNSETSGNVLIKLKESGYNTIRIFINPILISDTNESLANKYISNLSDFIKKAEKHNIYVILTTDMIALTFYGTELKDESDIWWWNDQYIFDEQIKLELKFWQLLIKELKNNSVKLETILAFAIRNEFFFHPDHSPFKGKSDFVKHPNNLIYDMSKEDERIALLDASFLHWSKTVRDAILESDPEALVTVGFYAPEPLGKPSKVAIEESELDFIDLHLYPEHASLSEYADYFNLLANKNKLIILGEFGILEHGEKTLEENKDILLEWKDEALKTYGLDAYLIWTWYTDIGVSLSIPDEDNVIFNAFSPILNQK